MKQTMLFLGSPLILATLLLAACNRSTVISGVITNHATGAPVVDMPVYMLEHV